MGDALVLAGEATMDEQYQWVKLLEKWWLEGGIDGDGNYGNEISYTLKYKPGDVDFDTFKNVVKIHQPGVRCCTVMPQITAVSYEYQPEEPITIAQYDALMGAISEQVDEDVGREHVDCGGGACPVEFGGKGEAGEEPGFAL